MKTECGKIILEDLKRYSPNCLLGYIEFVDETETKFQIPNKLVVRLYEGLKYHAEKNEVNFTEYCNNLFKNELD
jgi:hypothetical protein